MGSFVCSARRPKRPKRRGVDGGSAGAGFNVAGVAETVPEGSGDTVRTVRLCCQGAGVVGTKLLRAACAPHCRNEDCIWPAG